MIATHKTKVSFRREDGNLLPPTWRLAVSARPDFWEPESNARCHEYRLLAKKGEACVKYFLGTEKAANDALDELAKIIKIRSEHRDEIDLPLLHWGRK